MTGILFGLQIFGMALFYIVLPLFSIFFGTIVISMYIQHKMGMLHSWKEMTSRKVSPNIIWADDFREACELFLENTNDERIKRVLHKCIMNSMPLINDGDINRNRCSITGIPSWMLKEQLRINLKDQYYVDNWGDMPKKVV